ncbi:TIGR03618 family F420-dependent PPOX class oxidoreductase [Kribbella sp. CA-247076]|uniref:TIGR03618 family F420-dependent PPOX class oxidoreductase n=1 Tax=Kribbella sp. CA-247076 TaxID=3239941 RepID=UPI003D89E67D
MTTLNEFADLARAEQGLAVVSTVRADHTIQSSVVNLGVLDHPIDGDPVVAFVTYGKVKLRNLRDRRQVNLAVRSGWKWAAVEGQAAIIGPDDPHPGVDAERLRLILREIFTAAGGTHDDWDEYDRVMAADRRAAVFVRPDRIYGT